MISRIALIPKFNEDKQLHSAIRVWMALSMMMPTVVEKIESRNNYRNGSINLMNLYETLTIIPVLQSWNISMSGGMVMINWDFQFHATKTRYYDTARYTELISISLHLPPPPPPFGPPIVGSVSPVSTPTPKLNRLTLQ